MRHLHVHQLTTTSVMAAASCAPLPSARFQQKAPLPNFTSSTHERSRFSASFLLTKCSRRSARCEDTVPVTVAQCVQLLVRQRTNVGGLANHEHADLARAVRSRVTSSRLTLKPGMLSSLSNVPAGDPEAAAGKSSAPRPRRQRRAGERGLTRPCRRRRQSNACRLWEENRPDSLQDASSLCIIAVVRLAAFPAAVIPAKEDRAMAHALVW